MQLSSRGAVEKALHAELFLLFKHSPICPVSARAFREFEAFVGGREELSHGWIDVRSRRGLADRVAERTGVRHESPQVLLLERGRVLWSASHGSIDREALARAVP